MTDFKTPCKAPFNNMYVSLKGRVAPCWKLLGQCDDWSKDKSILDIWRGDQFKLYRDSLAQDKFINQCTDCEHNIKNNVWPLSMAYDLYPINNMPTLMEIELSNQCNLECIMCNGFLSSGIRKNRENLPPLPEIFDQSFIEQIKEFIPYLLELRINGGEPLAQSLVLKLCEEVSIINPNLKINIATNGTIYNKRIEKIFKKCNIHLNISIDSLIAQKYEEIRINAKWDVLMKNFHIFKNYCHQNNRSLCIMVNPMNNNWNEMIDFVKFTDLHQCNLWYNTVLYPKNLTIKDLPTEQIIEIYKNLKQKLKSVQGKKNYKIAEHLVEKQIKHWIF